MKRYPSFKVASPLGVVVAQIPSVPILEPVSRHPLLSSGSLCYVASLLRFQFSLSLSLALYSLSLSLSRSKGRSPVCTNPSACAASFPRIVCFHCGPCAEGGRSDLPSADGA